MRFVPHHILYGLSRLKWIAKLYVRFSVVPLIQNIFDVLYLYHQFLLLLFHNIHLFRFIMHDHIINYRNDYQGKQR